MPLITREFIWHRDSGFGHCHGESDFESAPKELRWVCFEASGENWPMPTLPAATCWNGQINRCSLAYWEGFVWEVFSHSMCYCMMSLPVSSFTKKKGWVGKDPILACLAQLSTSMSHLLPSLSGRSRRRKGNCPGVSPSRKTMGRKKMQP